MTSGGGTMRGDMNDGKNGGLCGGGAGGRIGHIVGRQVGWLIGRLTGWMAGGAVLLAACMPAGAADAQRQADVAQRGAQVMPFDVHATQHVFTKTDTGGTQRVVARDADDTPQVRRVREHLRRIQAEFQRGDYAEPARIHGLDMPGLAALRAAAPDRIDIGYTEVAGGAELAYFAHDPQLVAALHAWFDAQLDDHGADAMAGSMHRMHHHGATATP